ncbi:MAG: hypothetical protein SGILL_006758, partial [Bacillariaceae sp.]
LFLKTKTVPKTSSGKIARAWCRKGFLAGTLQVVFQKSFKGGEGTKTSFEIEPGQTPSNQAPLSSDKIQEIRALSRDDIMDKLRLDVARTAQIPPDSIDNDTALVTILDSLSISQFKGRLESAYGVKISDEYLFGENITMKKLAEVVKLGYAPDDTGAEGSSGNAPAPVATGTADGLAGALGFNLEQSFQILTAARRPTETRNAAATASTSRDTTSSREDPKAALASTNDLCAIQRI